MGTPDFAVQPLEALVNSGHEVTCAYTQPPRPAGRGKNDRKSPVHIHADALGIPVRHPKSLRSEQEQSGFASLDADIAVVVAYGLILPQPILDAPRLGCLNIHASLLPRWRGAAPIHRAIMAGDDETGVCIMQMEAGLDTGPVLLRGKMPISDTDTTGDLHDRLSKLGAELVVDVLGRLPECKPQPQASEGVTYAEKIEKAEARIDWTRPALEVARHINGLSPFPGAWTDIQGERVKILRAKPEADSASPGTHLGEFRIACGSGSVAVLEAQRQGKRPMSASDFLRGTALPDNLF